MDFNSISKVLTVKLIDLNYFFVTILSALVLIFFYKKMDSVLKMSLSIEYHTKSDPPLTLMLFRPFTCSSSTKLTLSKQLTISETKPFSNIF